LQTTYKNPEICNAAHPPPTIIPQHPYHLFTEAQHTENASTKNSLATTTHSLKDNIDKAGKLHS